MAKQKQKSKEVSHATKEPTLDPELGSSEEDSEEEEVIGEEGLQRVMELLGDDGLDEEGQMQLGMLNGDGSEDDEDEDDEDDSAHDDEELSNSEDDSGDEDEVDSELGSAELNGEQVEEDDEEEDGVELDALSDGEFSIDEDVVPRQKIVINNEEAMARIRENFQLDRSLPWTETLVCTYPNPIAVPDVDDDLNRELAFYKQALHCAEQSKKLAAAAKPPLPYSRPSDYFAEMVKSDSHMERIRQKLLDEKAGMKKSEQKKKEREHKKIGKQVQLEKLKERREKGKAEVEKVKGIKRKRKDMEDPTDDFDVALDDKDGDDSPNKKRQKKGGISRKGRDQKFGFGGKVGRRAKQNTKESSESIFGGSGPGKEKGAFPGRGQGGGRGGGQKTKRLGKSRRMNARR